MSYPAVQSGQALGSWVMRGSGPLRPWLPLVVCFSFAFFPWDSDSCGRLAATTAWSSLRVISARVRLSVQPFFPAAHMYFHLAKHYPTYQSLKCNFPSTASLLLSACGTTASVILEFFTALGSLSASCSSMVHIWLPVISSYRTWMFKGFEHCMSSFPFTVKPLGILSILTVFTSSPVHLSASCAMASASELLPKLFSSESQITAWVLNLIDMCQLST